MSGALIAIVAIAGMHYEGISFFWWFPVGALIVIIVALIQSKFSSKTNQKSMV
jgi:predicted ABC-type sugar transport system permease subunit